MVLIYSLTTVAWCHLVQKIGKNTEEVKISGVGDGRAHTSYDVITILVTDLVNAFKLFRKVMKTYSLTVY